MVAQDAVVADTSTSLIPSSLLLRVVPEPQGTVAQSGALAIVITNSIVDIIAFFLCIKLWFIDSEYDDNGELVFINFSVLAKSISCFKQFTTAYHLHTKGSAISGLVYLFGFILQSCDIVIYLTRKYKTWARTTIVGMATLISAGIFLLCRGMLIPDDHAWSTTAVPAIIIFVVLSEAALLVRSQGNESGGDQHLFRDLVMKLAEASISIYRWVESIAQTHSPLDAEKILNLVGGGLPVLIGAYQIARILYKMGIMCKVIKLLRKIHPVFAGEEEQPNKAAMEVDEDGDVEEQMAVKEVQVVVVAPAAA